MKRLKRIIEVFEGKLSRVEVEGNTVAVQLVDPATKQVAYRFVSSVPAMCDLSVTLSAALAQSGEVVNETAISPLHPSVDA